MLASSSFREADSILCNSVARHFKKMIEFIFDLADFFFKDCKEDLSALPCESRSGIRMSLAIWTELTYGNE